VIQKPQFLFQNRLYYKIRGRGERIQRTRIGVRQIGNHLRGLGSPKKARARGVLGSHRRKRSR